MCYVTPAGTMDLHDYGHILSAMDRQQLNPAQNHVVGNFLKMQKHKKQQTISRTKQQRQIGIGARSRLVVGDKKSHVNMYGRGR
jgi:hypothetical protein